MVSDITEIDPLAEEFSHQLLQIGSGALPLNNTLLQHVLQCGHIVSTLAELKEKVFPTLQDNFKNIAWFAERTVLAHRNESVNKVNHELLHVLPGDASTFVSIDTTIDEHAAVEYSVEFPNSLQPTGQPPHKLFLKKDVPIMLLRNLDPPQRCDGTRLIITTMISHVLQATIIAGCHRGEIAYIPCMPLIPSNVSFQFKRLQFPVRLCFPMAINKSQGQTLKIMGLNLQLPCVSHGQLYVACSRVNSADNLYIYSTKTGLTHNIVYPEALSASLDIC
ncbi:uncharacterized protein LOC115230494 [Octopus sinensis]|uniref:Uncharacterized protein LOC115230494 n=1 Tax=Octopus sinensis TaxID=2607531 RepID=A0A6P7TXN2_9MOLL|nr:uncharacterized protein LOC115230494 [Octopus sinensis]